MVSACLTEDTEKLRHLLIIPKASISEGRKTVKIIAAINSWINSWMHWVQIVYPAELSPLAAAC